MNRIKAIHIDDEMDSIEVMQMLIAEHCPQIELVGWANSVEDGLKLIENQNPNLVFLDVEMPGKNGFELLESLPQKSFHTIMVTGYENYALKAIKYSALDYILKPIDADDLKAALSKLEPENMLEDPRLAHFTTMHQKGKAAYNTLMVASATGFKNLVLNNIMYIKSEAGSYSTFHLISGVAEIVTKPLSHFESLLPINSFFRIHRSHMINKAYVDTYENSTGVLLLTNGEELMVSARKRSDFRKFMQG